MSTRADPVPPERASAAGTDPLAAALLPVLLHRINNVTQLLTTLNSVLNLSAADGGHAAAPVVRGDDLLKAAREADELGWLLGVLGCGFGADLLLERRHPGGLDAVVRLARGALASGGTELQLTPADHWPALAAAVPEPGDLCWLVAFGLWSAGRSTTPLHFAVRAADGGHALHCTGGAPVDWDPVRERLRRLPGIRLVESDAAWQLQLPAGWLEDEG